MSSCPTLSVILPSLNSADFIARALSSLAAQSYKQFEVIVADGGSVDGTLEIVAGFRRSLDVRVIQVGRGTIGMARNRGIAEAQGVYISFLDSDDFYLNGKLERAVRELDADRRYDGIFTSFLHYDSRTLQATVGRHYPRVVDLRREIFHHSTVNLNTLTLRKQSLTDRNIKFSEGPRGRLGEDWDLAAQLAEAGCNIGFLAIPTVVVVKGHASHTTIERQWKMRVSAIVTLMRADRRIRDDPLGQMRSIEAWLRKSVVVASLSGRPMVALKLLTLYKPSISRSCLRIWVQLSRALPRRVKTLLLQTLLDLKTALEYRKMRRCAIAPDLQMEVHHLTRGLSHQPKELESIARGDRRIGLS